MKDSIIKERRAFARFPVRILLRYFNLNLMGKALVQTQDISAKGLCLITKEELADETPLDIWLQLPGYREQIYIKGRVVWSTMIEPDKYRVGVNLENIELNPIILALKAIQVRINHS